MRYRNLRCFLHMRPAPDESYTLQVSFDISQSPICCGDSVYSSLDTLGSAIKQVFLGRSHFCAVFSFLDEFSPIEYTPP